MFAFEVATAPVAAVAVSSISVCAIAQAVVGVTDSTIILQGYAIGVIALITYLHGNCSFVKEVRVGRAEPIPGARQWKLPPHVVPPVPPVLASARTTEDQWVHRLPLPDPLDMPFSTVAPRARTTTR